MTVTLVGTPDREPCPHQWRMIEDGDFWWCRLCKRTESADDNPPDDDDRWAA